MSEKIVQLNEEVIKGQIKELVRGLCPTATCSRHPVGQQEVHEHEALGGGSGRRHYCWLTSFIRSLQTNFAHNF